MNKKLLVSATILAALLGLAACSGKVSENGSGQHRRHLMLKYLMINFLQQKLRILMVRTIEPKVLLKDIYLQYLMMINLFMLKFEEI